MIQIAQIEVPFSEPFRMAWNDKGIVRTAFGESARDFEATVREMTSEKRLAVNQEHVWVGMFESWFRGESTLLPVPVLYVSGTRFQQRAWDALRQIPFGETRTYAQQATAINSPRAVRAVGQANGRNPLPVIVPCHRVVASDGSLGGFSAGLDVKRWLLSIEQGE